LILLGEMGERYYFGWPRFSQTQSICVGMSSCNKWFFGGEFMSANARSKPMASAIKAQGPGQPQAV